MHVQEPASIKHGAMKAPELQPEKAAAEGVRPESQTGPLQFHTYFQGVGD